VNPNRLKKMLHQIRDVPSKKIKKKNDITCIKKMYIKIYLDSISAGLSHQKSNLSRLIRYCFDNNLKLIKPIFNLSGIHNNGISLRSDLSEYFDLDNIKVNGKQFVLFDDDKNNSTTTNVIENRYYEHGLLRNDDIFSNVSNANVSIPYVKEVYEIAQRVIRTIKDNYICIHVRRGDKITNNIIDVDTQPPNIKNIISKSDMKTVYIMTNRKNELKNIMSLCSPEEYDIYFYTDFKDLKNIDNNYLLFCVENVIMDMAPIRCSTFNTPRKKYYQYYLTDSPGWQ
jgi:hypothetical protein